MPGSGWQQQLVSRVGVPNHAPRCEEVARLTAEAFRRRSGLPAARSPLGRPRTAHASGRSPQPSATLPLCCTPLYLHEQVRPARPLARAAPAVGVTATLLHPDVPLSGVSMWMERGCQQMTVLPTVRPSRYHLPRTGRWCVRLFFDFPSGGAFAKRVSHFAVCLFVHTQQSQQAGPFSVARLNMDLPFHDRLAYSRVHRKSASPLPPLCYATAAAALDAAAASWVCTLPARLAQQQQHSGCLLTSQHTSQQTRSTAAAC